MELLAIDPLMNNWAIARDLIKEMKRKGITEKDLIEITAEIHKQITKPRAGE
jgi:hypothetical protein